MPLPGDEADYVLDVPEKTGVENKGRHEKKHRQQDRDIRKLAAAILQLQSEGTLSDRIIESLVEVMRRG